MRRLLALLWRAFSLLGVVLSLRRWWRTLVDQEERREVRFAAGLILLLMVGLLLWSVAAGTGRRDSQRGDTALPAVTEIVVDFRDDVSLAAIDAWDDKLGIELRPNSPESVDERLMIADARGLDADARELLLAELRADPRVEAAEENFYMTALGDAGAQFTPNDPRYAEQWNLRLIGMPIAWDKATGKGAVVAVIDSGVAFERERDIPVASDLKQTAWTKPYDFVTNRAKAYDDHGHGTHVSGTIAQSTNNRHGVAGIAFNATIMPLKVLSAAGYGNVSDIADAIHFAADNGAQVINMSLGGPRSSAVMRRACTYAHQKGVTIVCAAGNGRREGVIYPAAYPECIAVSSVGPSGDLAFYSSWGKEIDLAAPGGEYRSPDDRQNGVLQNTIFQKKDVFEYWQGTSMASPHVAGVAALLVEAGVKGPEAIRNRLKQSATPKGDPKKFGAGLLNAAAAVGAKEEAAIVAETAPRARPVGWSPIHAVSLFATVLLLGWLSLGAAPGRRLPMTFGALASAWGLSTLSGAGSLLTNAAGCALWPAGLLLALYGVKPLRPWLTGLCVGYAAGCSVLAVGGAGSAAWLLGNGLAAGVLAYLASRPER